MRSPAVRISNAVNSNFKQGRPTTGEHSNICFIFRGDKSKVCEFLLGRNETCANLSRGDMQLSQGWYVSFLLGRIPHLWHLSPGEMRTCCISPGEKFGMLDFSPGKFQNRICLNSNLNLFIFCNDISHTLYLTPKENHTCRFIFCKDISHTLYLTPKENPHLSFSPAQIHKS